MFDFTAECVSDTILRKKRLLFDAVMTKMAYIWTDVSPLLSRVGLDRVGLG